MLPLSLPQFFHPPSAMGFDGLGAQAELIGDLCAGMTEHHHIQNFPFTQACPCQVCGGDLASGRMSSNNTRVMEG